MAYKQIKCHNSRTDPFTYDPNYPRVTKVDSATVPAQKFVYSYNPLTSNIPNPPVKGLGCVEHTEDNLVTAGNTLQCRQKINYGYDELGRVTSRTLCYPTSYSSGIPGSLVSTGVSQTIGYDALGRVSTETDPLGTFTYVYNQATGRIDNFSGAQNAQWTKFAYEDLTKNFDLKGISNCKAYPGVTTTSDFGYSRNALGNITSWTQTFDGATTGRTFSFGYDDKNQLVSAVLRSAADAKIQNEYSYIYDAAGNRTNEQVGSVVGTSASTWITKSTYSPVDELFSQQPGGVMRVTGSLDKGSKVTIKANGQSQSALMGSDNKSFSGLASVSLGDNSVTVSATDQAGGGSASKALAVVVGGQTARTLNYDLVGNLRSDGSRSFEWNNVGQLVAIVKGTHRSEFTYNAVGQRVRIKEIDGCTGTGTGTITRDDWFHWDGSELLAVTDGRDTAPDAVLTFHTHGRTKGLSTKYWYTRDHLGCIRELTDINGRVVCRYDYDPYGRMSRTDYDSSGNVAAPGSISMPHQLAYTGHYFHEASGIYLTMFRGYDPNMGRWISRDPLGLAAGLNCYAYVGNNPINLCDPLGLFSWKGFGMGVAEGAAGVAVGVAVGVGFVMFAPILLPASAVTALAFGATAVGGAVGGFATGKALYEFGSGEEWSATGSGRTLCDDEQSERLGQGLVGLAALGIAAKGAFGGAAESTPIVVNEETIQAALKGSTMQTRQSSVSIPVIENYVRKLEAGSVPPPIKIVDGNVIYEGNHRYIAGRLFGQEPPVEAWPSTGSSVAPQPIQKINLDPADWGKR